MVYDRVKVGTPTKETRWVTKNGVFKTEAEADATGDLAQELELLELGDDIRCVEFKDEGNFSSRGLLIKVAPGREVPVMVYTTMENSFNCAQIPVSAIAKAMVPRTSGIEKYSAFKYQVHI
jgi:hypothetical protein